MAKLKDKVQSALQEARILILGAQVLMGFQFRSAFEPGFERLPPHSQYLKLVGLGLLTVAIGLLVWPGAYHRIVNGGEDSKDLHRARGPGRALFRALVRLHDLPQGRAREAWARRAQSKGRLIFRSREG